MFSARTMVVSTLASIAFTGFFFTGRFLATEIKSRASVALVSTDAVPRPGTAYVFVYVGSSRCGPSNREGLNRRVSDLMAMMRTKASHERKGFVTIGIARENSARSGLAHLERVANFDEIASGQGVLNVASAHFNSRDHKGMPATPQLVILERIVKAGVGGVDPTSVEELVLLRKVGVDEILKWHALNAPLPASRNAPDTALIAIR